jgi:hypothetical protein
MISRPYETEVTLTIDGDERDVTVRANVCIECNRGEWSASVDGPIKVRLALVDGIAPAWVDMDYLVVDERDHELAGDALCELALTDDSDADYRPRPWFGREGARYAR